MTEPQLRCKDIPAKAILVLLAVDEYSPEHVDPNFKDFLPEDIHALGYMDDLQNVECDMDKLFKTTIDLGFVGVNAKATSGSGNLQFVRVERVEGEEVEGEEVEGIKLGFVVKLRNGSKDNMETVMRRAIQGLEDYSTLLLFYMGHAFGAKENLTKDTKDAWTMILARCGRIEDHNDRILLEPFLMEVIEEERKENIMLCPLVLACHTDLGESLPCPNKRAFKSEKNHYGFFYACDFGETMDDVSLPAYAASFLLSCKPASVAEFLYPLCDEIFIVMLGDVQPRLQESDESERILWKFQLDSGQHKERLMMDKKKEEDSLKLKDMKLVRHHLRALAHDLLYEGYEDFAWMHWAMGHAFLLFPFSTGLWLG